MMLSIARADAPSFNLTGITAKSGPTMIQDTTALDASAEEVVRLASPLDHLDGFIVAAFGDPGVTQVAAELTKPVIGIGGAAARLAVQHGAAFAVVTTTNKLVDRIDALMLSNSEQIPYLGTFVTTGDTDTVMSDPSRLDAALQVQIMRAVKAGAHRVIIGGGPLGMAAVRLASQSPIPLINPISAAVLEMGALMGFRKGRAL